ncbi:MAG: electron transfer flavoprotein-ubiquinone oxidoreductase [Proteobacteria bacterium]|nr:electron transfer flavoprotein-ubiquinone oxidoreductase [Pseudomonadota bacterium]
MKSGIVAAMTEIMEYDVIIVGGGPAGLGAAIRLRQLAKSGGRDVRVCVLEKGSEVGAHILSGAVIEPRALNELIPDWKEKGAPLTTPVAKDSFYFLSRSKAFRLPTSPSLNNHGNYIASLSDLCRWLAKYAEAEGVEIFPGFPAAQAIIEKGRVLGVRTGEFGRGKDGKEKPGYQPPMEIRAPYTLFAEGCRGSLSQQLMREFKLREGVAPQTYGIGIKEVWQVAPEKSKPGTVLHSVGWPLGGKTYGGSFLYHMQGGLVSVGLITGLDYENPYLDPFLEFQRFKTHPSIRGIFEDGKRIAYGARAINEGGLQSIPKLVFPGGALIGCSAGFVNVAKIKGSHTAMKSGMLAAESVYAALGADKPAVVEAYPMAVKTSWIYKELFAARNIRPAFHWGLWPGMLYAALEEFLLRGRGPWTLRHRPDHTSLKPKSQCAKIDYPKPDGVLTFDRMSSVFLSSTNHEEDQPCHLTLKDASVPIAHNLPLYDAPEQRYCPAGVYEIVEEASGPRLQINAQNCVHCKTCDIKDPTQNIVWVTPEGGGGPNYSGT